MEILKIKVEKSETEELIETINSIIIEKKDIISNLSEKIQEELEYMAENEEYPIIDFDKYWDRNIKYIDTTEIDKIVLEFRYFQDVVSVIKVNFEKEKSTYEISIKKNYFLEICRKKRLKICTKFENEIYNLNSIPKFSKIHCSFLTHSILSIYPIEMIMGEDIEDKIDIIFSKLEKASKDNPLIIEDEDEFRILSNGIHHLEREYETLITNYDIDLELHGDIPPWYVDEDLKNNLEFEEIIILEQYPSLIEAYNKIVLVSYPLTINIHSE